MLTSQGEKFKVKYWFYKKKMTFYPSIVVFQG